MGSVCSKDEGQLLNGVEKKNGRPNKRTLIDEQTEMLQTNDSGDKLAEKFQEPSNSILDKFKPMTKRRIDHLDQRIKMAQNVINELAK